MSSEWKEVKLGEACTKIGSGVTPRGGDKVYKTMGVSLIRSQNVYDFAFDYNGLVFVDDEQAHKMKNVAVIAEDILLNITGDSVARCCIVPENVLPARVNQHVSIIRPRRQIINPKYLLYWLNNYATKETLLSLASTGATRKALTKDMIENLIVTIPSFSEQKSIADTLSCLDDKIELNNRINKTLEEMAQAIFKSWFVDFEPFQDGEFEDSELGKIPKGWRIVELGEVAKFVKGKKPTELLGIKILENEEQYLTIDVLKGGNPQFACVDKMVLSNIYDILMVMDGASSGTIYFGLKGIVASTIAKLEVTNEQLREVVYQYIKVNETEVKAHNTGSAIPHTDKGYVLRCKIAVPDDEILKQISMNLKKTREIITNNSNQNQILAAIRDMLLPKLMNGEIRVPIEEVQVHE